MATKNKTQQPTIDTPVIDASELNRTLDNKVKALEQKRKDVVALYKAEKKVAVQGSPMYRPYFGNTMSIVINGVAIYVPMDGQRYEIPETFAAVFLDRISRIDEQLNMRKRMAAISENVESYAGEKCLIKRV
jgi:hypothetical protein